MARCVVTDSIYFAYFKGKRKAFVARFWAGKALMAVMSVYAGAYYFKYNANVSKSSDM